MVDYDYKFKNPQLRRIAMLAEVLIDRCVRADQSNASLKAWSSPSFRQSIWRMAYETYKETNRMIKETRL